jgi:hypothetical protein
MCDLTDLYGNHVYTPCVAVGPNRLCGVASCNSGPCSCLPSVYVSCYYGIQRLAWSAMCICQTERPICQPHAIVGPTTVRHMYLGDATYYMAP